MVQSVKIAADAVLNKAVNSTPGVPGVVGSAKATAGLMIADLEGAAR